MKQSRRFLTKLAFFYSSTSYILCYAPNMEGILDPGYFRYPTPIIVPLKYHRRSPALINVNNYFKQLSYFNACFNILFKSIWFKLSIFSHILLSLVVTVMVGNLKQAGRSVECRPQCSV